MARRSEILRRARGGLVARTLDAAIGAVSPRLGLRRREARLRLAMAQSYDVVGGGRTRRKRTGAVGSADNHLSAATLRDLRELCRDHDRNSSLFAGVLDRAVANIVGPSLSVRPNTGDKSWDDRAGDWIRREMESDRVDVRGEHDFATLVGLALRAVWTDGDQVWLLTRGGAVQPIEAHRIGTPRTERGNDAIHAGVKRDKAGRALGFFIFGDTHGGYGGAIEEAEYRRRAECLWPAYRKRVSQTRGVPYLAAGLGLFDRLDGYLDSETLAAQLNSHNVWKLTDNGDDALPGQMNIDDPNETADDRSSYDELLRSEPGTVHRLRPGEDFEVVGLNRPGDTFEPYITTVLRLFGAGVGYPLELVLLDFSKTNYSSARAALQEARRHFRLWQRMLGASIVTPWYRRRISQGMAAGELPAAMGWDRHIVQWPGWDWIDPQKEASAFEKLLSLKVKSRTEVIRERGREPAEVYDELKRDEEMLAERELVGAASDETVETGGPAETGEPDSGDEMSAGDDDGA